MNQFQDNPDMQYSPACERNRDPILEQLKPRLSSARKILEIGSGTGQHAAYFGQFLPHLIWQTSDRVENHASISAWVEHSGVNNVLLPIELDVAQSNWPEQKFDATFTANTCHIMSWSDVEKMFQGVSQVLTKTGCFFIYGPFNYDGQFSSSSNQAFDASLKLTAPHRGIRDMTDMRQLAQANQFKLSEDITMPANNRLLIFTKINNVIDI
jgi:cyclopropane fatty-acyl-phospholipid synthase-like methyltransferase